MNWLENILHYDMQKMDKEFYKRIYKIANKHMRKFMLKVKSAMR